MTVFKAIFLIFFTLILFILEISLPVIPMGVSLIFVFLVILLIRENKDKDSLRLGLKYIFLVSVWGGILLDCYSIFFPGTFLVSLLIVSYLSKRFLLSKFNTNRILSVLIFSLIIGLIYQLLVSVFSFVFSVLFISSDFKIYFNEFYWFSLLQAIILNGALTTVIIFGLKSIKPR